MAIILFLLMKLYLLMVTKPTFFKRTANACKTYFIGSQILLLSLLVPPLHLYRFLNSPPFTLFSRFFHLSFSASLFTSHSSLHLSRNVLPSHIHTTISARKDFLQSCKKAFEKKSNLFLRYRQAVPVHSGRPAGGHLTQLFRATFALTQK